MLCRLTLVACDATGLVIKRQTSTNHAEQQRVLVPSPAAIHAGSQASYKYPTSPPRPTRSNTLTRSSLQPLQYFLASTQRSASSMASHKLFALAVLLVVVAAAEASIIRKTITTVEETVEPNDGEMEQCREDMRRHKLGSCRSYMQYGKSSVLAMAAAGGNPEVPRPCCNELERTREECRCYKIEKMAQEMMRGGAREMREEMMSRAENLPTMCGMGPQRCSIRLVSY